MNVQKWMKEGYGCQIFHNDNYEKIIRFISKHADTIGLDCDFDKAFELARNRDIKSIEEMFDSPICWVVADIINFKEGFGAVFGFRPDQENPDKEYIGVDPRYPWEISEKERSLSRQDYSDILTKYGDELGTIDPVRFFVWEVGKLGVE